MGTFVMIKPKMFSVAVDVYFLLNVEPLFLRQPRPATALSPCARARILGRKDDKSSRGRHRIMHVEPSGFPLYFTEQKALGYKDLGLAVGFFPFESRR